MGYEFTDADWCEDFEMHQRVAEMEREEEMNMTQLENCFLKQLIDDYTYDEYPRSV